MELASLAELERSHRRHDEVMAELLEAARRLAAGRADRADLDRVHAAVAYFERAATRHFVDEEGSVFPRLSSRRPELAAALAELSAERPAQIALQADLAAAVRRLDGNPRPSAGKRLLDAATRLAEVQRAHIGREHEIFAAAREALTAKDDADIVAEMETRRGRDDKPRTRAAPRATAPRTPRRAAKRATAARKRPAQPAKPPAATSRKRSSPAAERAAATSRKRATGKTASTAAKQSRRSR